MSDYRVGYGEDIHRLVVGRPLFLCGLSFPFPKGLDGHSDADVALHALADALLGSLGLGDIGKYFPPNDPTIKGINSEIIVKKCLGMVKEKGYSLNNVDLSIIAEAPHLAPHIAEMKERLSLMLGLASERISVKAMTNEGLDAVGKGEAIKAVCLVSVVKL